ncbi:MAG: flagellar M-ring protein FliF [Rhodospirillales bacterium]|nr:flagellar M-ring protein FliF [Rhodospirillales bacterium]
MTNLLENLRGLGAARLLALGLAAAAVAGVLLLLALRAGTPPMGLLYSHLGLADAGRMTQALDSAHIPYTLTAGGRTIMVPDTRVPAARLLLARQGLPSGGAVGYEIFDHQQGFFTSRFRDRINETRALEGELARTIGAIDGIAGVRVHLVLPNRSAFVTHPPPARAAILLAMRGAARLDRASVDTILNLVVAAVPGLKPQDVAIADTEGRLLAHQGNTGDPTASGPEALREAIETRIAHEAEAILAPSLGQGNVHAQASVVMNFDTSQETVNSFDPNQQVTRSEQTSSETRTSSRAAATVSVANNLPGAQPASQGTGSQDKRQQDTTNYEIGSTVRTIVHAAPSIARISLAIMVADVATKHKNGTLTYAPRSQAELNQISSLVKSAIGFDAKRGDSVTIVSMRMPNRTALNAPVNSAARTLLQSLTSPGMLAGLTQTLVLALVAILAVLLVFRPVMLRLTAPPPAPQPTPLPLPAASLPEIAIPTDAVRASPSLPRIEGTVPAAALRNLSDLVEHHPDETLSIIRAWLAESAG